MGNGYHDQWEPPKGGWGCLLIILITGWALIFLAARWLRSFF